MRHACTPAAHPRLPAPGDRVLYVGRCDGPPILVTVVEVRMGDRDDLNVWAWRRDPLTGNLTPVLDRHGDPVLVDWPNPNLLLRDDAGGEYVTRQIRHRGSPGWTWPLYLPTGV